MAGHSQFKNIMYRKGAQDAKRAKIFTKIIRELTVSAKMGGADPEANSRLRAAILSARTANMPKETLERAIKRGAGGEDTTDYQEVRYEGYGPGGVALIVETLTDNRNRTAPEVRSIFSKHGGSLGEINSVSFMFDRRGVIRYPATLLADTLLEIALEGGAQDLRTDEEGHEVLCDIEDFGGLRDLLISRFGDPEAVQLAFIPKVTTPLSGALLETLGKLIDTLEDNDDVQRVWCNVEEGEGTS
jgi:YebC/PmpR family DNA-binding regulatory protein